jgi:hypothetical protein
LDIDGNGTISGDLQFVIALIGGSWKREHLVEVGVAGAPRSAVFGVALSTDSDATTIRAYTMRGDAIIRLFVAAVIFSGMGVVRPQ